MKQSETNRPELSAPLQVWTAKDCKNAIIRDLVVRAGILIESARSGKHDKAGRNCLMVAARVLHAAVDDIERNAILP